MDPLSRKNMLYKTKVDYETLNGKQVNNYAMNHIFGCSHGCKFPCYAMMNSIKRNQVDSYCDWINPVLFTNTLEILERELETKSNIDRVHLCFTTDPLPYNHSDFSEDKKDIIKNIHNMTCSVIETINRHNIPVTILTKGVLFEPENIGDRYILHSPIDGRLSINNPNDNNYYGITLVSLNEGFRNRYEPYASTIQERLDSLRYIHDCGFKTWVSMEPFPAITPEGNSSMFGSNKYGELNAISSMGESTNSNLKLIVEKQFGSTDYNTLIDCLCSVYFVDRLVFGRWNYNENMPTDVINVDKWYHNASIIVENFCEKYNIECVVKKGTR